VFQQTVSQPTIAAPMKSSRQFKRPAKHFFAGTTWRGHRAMRVSVCNWRTSYEDVERVVKAVASVLTSNRYPLSENEDEI
jgi:hypothetical protein